MLARAVELDARDTADVSLEQLHLIAAEAGIRPDALERALGELRTGALAGSVAPARPLALADRLAQLRGHVFLAIVVGVASLTPGDVLGVNLQYMVPLYALYELALQVARRRGGPTTPMPATTEVAVSAHVIPPTDATRGTRSLVLRPRTLRPAI